jgi:hypothetical protein
VRIGGGLEAPIGKPAEAKVDKDKSSTAPPASGAVAKG